MFLSVMGLRLPFGYGGSMVAVEKMLAFTFDFFCFLSVCLSASLRKKKKDCCGR